MKRVFTFLLIIPFFVKGQTTTDFEDFSLALDTFLNGSATTTGFSSGNLNFDNVYDSQFGSWYGFSISTMRDVTTASFTNQYSCIAGEGNAQSATYGVAYMSYLTGNATMKLTGNAAGGALEGMYINNSTYAYLSMRDGDMVAKKFGGASGDDPDYFYVSIQKYLAGNLVEDSIIFYLADFRSSDNNQDYIVNEWTYIDLSSLGNADSLSFTLYSSDVGQFGINTPLYFCVDDITTKDTLATSSFNREITSIQLYPNPTHNTIQFRSDKRIVGKYQIVDVLGKVVLNGDCSSNEMIDIAVLTKGTYHFIIFDKQQKIYRESFIKN